MMHNKLVNIPGYENQFRETRNAYLSRDTPPADRRLLRTHEDPSSFRLEGGHPAVNRARHQ